MHTLINAVVLRYTCKATPLVSLYTSTHGRITVRDGRQQKHRQPLHVGDIIEGNIDRLGNTWRLLYAQTQTTRPDHATPTSLYWQHHLLDVYYCYIPLEQPSAELFSLLLLFMRLDTAPDTIWKAALVALFDLLGYGVPDGLQGCCALVRQIDEHARTYNTANVLHINWQKEYAWDEQKANEWLIKIIQQHAHYSLLKTQYLFSQLYQSGGS